MPRYVAFLRGVSPSNAKMADLRRCVEAAGFAAVKTVLSSGNVAFDASSKSVGAIERRIEEALARLLGRRFPTIVRPARRLQELLADDPFAAHQVPAAAKRVVTFLRPGVAAKVALPIELDGARILAATRSEAFTAYVPHPKGAVFMALIEKTFGADVTTRTWETVRKCAAA